MRWVTCYITKEKGSSEEYYYAPDGHYYKTKELYDKRMHDKDVSKEIIRFINQKILCSAHSQMHSFIMKNINDCGLQLDDILRLLKENCENIKKYISDKNMSPTSQIVSIFNCISKFNIQSSYSGCYMIRNIETDGIYVGESINIFSRFVQHVSDLYNNSHHCQKLQDAFNVTKDIQNFEFKPLFLLPIANIDKREEKEETLYLEAAYYLKFRREKKELYNTINPYAALKQNYAHYLEENIDCKNVLVKLWYDKYHILDKETLKLVKENIEKSIEIPVNTTDIKTPNKSESTTKETSSQKINNKTQSSEKASRPSKSSIDKSHLHYITHIFDECKQNGILPEEYGYRTVRQKLVDNGLIYIDESGKTVTTEKSINNKWYIVKSISKNDGKPTGYYITDTGKEEIIKILKSYDKSEFLLPENNQQ